MQAIRNPATTGLQKAINVACVIGMYFPVSGKYAWLALACGLFPRYGSNLQCGTPPISTRIVDFIGRAAQEVVIAKGNLAQHGSDESLPQ